MDPRLFALIIDKIATDIQDKVLYHTQFEEKHKNISDTKSTKYINQTSFFFNDNFHLSKQEM